MYCKKCGRDLPDTTEICPVCGTPTRKAIRKQRASLTVRCIYAVDLLTFLTGIVHAFLLATASHYVRGTQYGLLEERWHQYALHPALRWVDILFTILLIAMFVFAVLMRYQLMQGNRLGLVFLGIAVGLALLWGIQYPLMTRLVTGIPSRVLGFSLIQAAVFALAAAFPTVYLFRSDEILY